MEDVKDTPGSMAERIHARDWSRSPAGPPGSWPPDIQSLCRIMLRSATPMGLLIGRAGAFIYNDAVRALIGEAYDEVLGQPIVKVFDGVDDFYLPLLDRVFEGKSAVFRDLPFRLFRNGAWETCWFDLEYTPVVDAHGVIHGALVIGNETTGRVQSYQDLRLARDKLDHALDASGIVGAWTIDFATDTMHADDRVARLLNVPPDIARGGAATELFLAGVYPDDLPQVRAALERARTSGVYMCQHRVVGPDGVRWIAASGRAGRLPDGEGAAAFTGVVVDVTSQIETAAALAESEQRFRTYTEALPHIVFSCNTDGRTTYLNRRWYEFSGQPETAETVADWLTCVHPDDQAELLASWRQALASGEPCRSVARHRNGAGAYRWARAVVLPIRDQAGAITSWIGTLTDIHEARLLEAEKETVSHELEHRIRNLFALVQGLISITAREDHTLQSFTGQLRSRLSALHHAHGLVRDGAASPGSGSSSLLWLIRALLEPYASGRNRASVSGDDATAPARAITWLALIFHELATNATKYGAFSTTDGAVTVTSERIGEILRITWKETGAPPTAQADSARNGFGSRLLGMIVEGNLRGAIRRSVEPDGVRVVLELPASAFGQDATSPG